MFLKICGALYCSFMTFSASISVLYSYDTSILYKLEYRCLCFKNQIVGAYHLHYKF